MSKVRADQYTNKEGTGAPSFPNGVSVTGIITATSFSGSLAGSASTATVATNAYGLVGGPNISVGNITASGNVSVGGTLTYEDVTNVDSIGIITARNGINVTGGTITGDGSGLTNLDAAPTIQATASGAIAADKPCIVNANGTVSQVVQNIIPSVTTAIDTELSSDGTYQIEDTAWINSTKFIILTTKINDSNKARYFFGSVDGNGAITLTAGADYTNNNANMKNGRVAVDTSTERFLTINMDQTSSEVYLKGGKVNGAGTDITWGTRDAWNTGASQQACAVSSNNDGGFMITYRNSNGNWYFRHVQLDASLNISRSDSVAWSNPSSSSNNLDTTSIQYIPATSSYWVIMQDYHVTTYPPNGVNINNGGYFRAAWATSNGTGSAPTMSQATNTPFTGPAATTAYPVGQMGYQPDLSYDSTTSKGILTWRRVGTGKPTAAVLSFTSTSNQPTYTAAVDLNDYSCDRLHQTWNSSTKEVVCYFATNATDVDTEIKTFTISGNTLVDANHNLNVFAGVNYQYLAIASNPTSNRVITATKDQGNGDYLSASTVDIPVTTNNITAENFIGFADAAYADTATAKIKIVGNTTTQSGLTAGQKYYVQLNATLATTPADISVVAGTALSPTKLIIKG